MILDQRKKIVTLVDVIVILNSLSLRSDSALGSASALSNWLTLVLVHSVLDEIHGWLIYILNGVIKCVVFRTLEK